MIISLFNQGTWKRKVTDKLLLSYSGGYYRSEYQDGVFWSPFLNLGNSYSLMRVVMKIRPVEGWSSKACDGSETKCNDNDMRRVTACEDQCRIKHTAQQASSGPREERGCFARKTNQQHSQSKTLGRTRSFEEKSMLLYKTCPHPLMQSETFTRATWLANKC